MRLRGLLSNTKFIRYLIVGVTTVAVDVGLLFFLAHFGHVNVYVAATVSFWSSLVVNFGLNKLWTFEVRRATSHHLLFYGLIILLNYSVGLGFIALAQTLGVGYLIGKLAALGLTTVWNFFLYKYVVFVDHDRAWFNLPERLRAKRAQP